MGSAVAAAGLMLGCSTPKPTRDHPVRELPPRSFTRAYTVPGDRPIQSIEVFEKNLYVYAEGHRVTAVDRGSGTYKYTMTVTSPRERLRPLVELRNKIVFPADTLLDVFNDKGTHLYTIQLTKPLLSNAAGEGDTVYFGVIGFAGGVGRGLVEAYDVSSKDAPFRWEYLPNNGGLITAAPAVSNGAIYSGSSKGEIDAVNAARSQIWSTEGQMVTVYDQIKADLKTDDAGIGGQGNGLYVASHDTKLYCLNKNTGKVQWQYYAGVILDQAPVVTIDTVYLKVPDKGIVAITKDKAAPYDRPAKWEFPTATQFLAQDAKYAYLAEPAEEDGNYRIVAVDKETGQRAFASDRDDFVVFGTNRFKEPVIYAGFADGSVMAVKPVLTGGVIGEIALAATDGRSIAMAQVRSNQNPRAATQSRPGPQ